MKKLLLTAALCTLTTISAEARESDYYEQVCEQYYHQDRELDGWCDSLKKHARDGQSTKNDKGHIDDLMRDESRFEVERHDAPPPPPPGHYDDWSNHQPGAYGNYQPAYHN